MWCHERGFGRQPHSETPTQHFAGCLAFPGAFAAAEVKLVIDFWFEHYTRVGGTGRGAVRTAGDGANLVNATVIWACACGDVVGPEL